MATDIDLFAIKEKIVDILDSDSTLFSATGASDKVRKIEAGAPRMSELVRETTLPHIWVTNDVILESIRPSTISESNNANVTVHTINLRVIIIADEKDGFKAEEVLDDFVKLIKEDIQENYDLRTPGGAESTSVADSCVVTGVSVLDSTITGRHRQGQIISLRVIVTTG